MGKTRSELESARAAPPSGRAYPSPLSAALVRQVISEFAINPKGPHGTAHWMRVRQNGLRLAELTGANPTVVELFALFHDSKRWNEGRDPEHGPRGARNAQRFMEAGRLGIADDEFDQLFKACWGHTYEDVEDPCITVLTCWDADRLDLGRVGIVPDPARLCTEPARDESMIEWAYGRSLHWVERYW